jgi:hypothetical protein
LAAFGIFNASATACSAGGRDEIFDKKSTSRRAAAMPAPRA